MHSSRQIWVLLAAAMGFLAGCSYLRLTETPRHGPDDWSMYGRTVERTNVAHTAIAPPLVQIWEYDASAGFSPYSAAIVDSLLFVGNLQGEVHAIHMSTGKGMGNYDFGPAVVGTPVVDRGTMFIPISNTDRGLLAYDLRQARVVWRARIGEVETAPLLIGKYLYVTTTQGKLICVEKGSGDVVWTYSIPSRTRTRTVRSSPASDSTVVVFGSDNGTVYAIDLKDGTLRWGSSTGGAVVASPSINRGKVLVGSLDKSFYAFDLNSGAILWKRDLNATLFASQAVHGGRIYVGTAGREIYCLDAEDGDVVWKATVDQVVNSAPLLSGDILYIGSIGKTLYAFSALTGQEIWRYSVEGRIKSMPIASKNRLIVLTEDRSVLAFQPSSEK